MHTFYLSPKHTPERFGYVVAAVRSSIPEAWVWLGDLWTPESVHYVVDSGHKVVITPAKPDLPEGDGVTKLYVAEGFKATPRVPKINPART